MAFPLFTFLQASRRLSRNARLSRPRFEAERLQRFRQLVRHAQRHSPYYGAIIKERGLRAETCCPEDFPVLTKRLLQENFDEIVTDRRVTKAAISQFLQHSRDPEERYLNEFVVLHTSGSSGEVGYFTFSMADWMQGLAGLARLNPPQLRRRRIVFFGATGGHFGGVSWAVSGRLGVGRYLYDIATFDINAPFTETLARLNEFQPHLVTGYATGNKLLAEAQLAGRLTIRPESVQCGGEPLSSGDQAWLEEVFSCPCANVYGATETMVMGVARSGDPGMTLFDDDLIVEPNTDHSLVTNLFNRTMPLIRYRIDDGLRIRNAISPYGPYPVIEPVVGRNEWIPAFRNSQGEMDFISPHIINEIFIPGIWRFQMRWIDETSFRFAICLDRGLSEEGRAVAMVGLENRLNEILGQKKLGHVKFTVEVVDDIAVDARTRKFKLILPPANDFA